MITKIKAKQLIFTLILTSCFFSLPSKSTTKKETILITGGAGYIGSHITHALAKQNYNVIILDLLKHNQKANFPWATLIVQDFADEKTLEKIFTSNHVTTVFHCAAAIDVAESVANPGKYYEENVTKLITLLNMMVKHNVKQFIFSSSCALYGPPLYQPIDELHPTAPCSPYGATKLIGEKILADYEQAHNIRSVSLRYFNVVGTDPALHLDKQYERKEDVTPIILRAALKNKQFTIFGSDYPTNDGTAARDYVHILDISNANVRAMDYLTAGGRSECINVGGGVSSTLINLLNAAELVTDKIIQKKFGPRRAGDIPAIYANTAKATKLLGWHPQRSTLPELLASALAWEVAQ